MDTRGIPPTQTLVQQIAELLFVERVSDALTNLLTLGKLSSRYIGL